MTSSEHTWIELDEAAVMHNIGLFRRHIGDKLLMVAVKGNAYGHGLREIVPMFVRAGIDWFGVHSLDEAIGVRDAGAENNVLILGYVPFERLADAVQRDFHMVIASWETADALARVAASQQKVVPVHIKIETGTNRQGVDGRELQILARFVEDSPYLRLEGLTTHFANIEDTTDHNYAMRQLERFEQQSDSLAKHGIKAEMRHTASSAATMLFRSTHFDMVRLGISAYGLWPSRETYVSLLQEGHSVFPLRPILSWKTLVSQLKEVKAGAYIGYGCSYRTTRDIRLAVLPIGYYDGYDRGLSNIGYVLIRGKRAPVRGRICMNLMMVDVTDIPEVQQEDEVILIGYQGDEHISADLLASMIGTINYEFVTRLPHHIPRLIPNPAFGSQ